MIPLFLCISVVVEFNLRKKFNNRHPQIVAMVLKSKFNYIDNCYENILTKTLQVYVCTKVNSPVGFFNIDILVAECGSPDARQTQL